MFSTEDLKHIEENQQSLAQVEKQLQRYSDRYPFVQLARAATISDGIQRLTSGQIADYGKLYQSHSKNTRLIKFVPASGAATRMFKHLHGVDDNEPSDLLNTFLKNIKNFAFYESLVASHSDLESDLSKKKYSTICQTVLGETGLNYAFLPKAFIQFHKYSSEVRTAMQEQLQECQLYCRGSQGTKIHFTVSAEHLELFKNAADNYQEIDLSFSLQHKSTNSLAVNLEKKPFRTDDGRLLFRPGGHGALLLNLNQLDADLIFLKNIDNVCHQWLLPTTVKYKQALAGFLLEKKNMIHGLLKGLTDQPKASDIETAKKFIKEELQIEITGDDPKTISDILHRPIRVCGMVKNEGEPGGGPFWVTNTNGTSSLQIVESAQIDTNNESQQNLFKSSTHFNPVDVVLYKIDHTGKPFDLLEYRDDEAGFIVTKSQKGRDLESIELPGLWNGSMANWITYFVEVPIETFNPVKSVNDLLRPAHQGRTSK